MKTRKNRFIISATSALLLTPAAFAVDGTWNINGGGSWDTNTNWQLDTIADGANSTAYFNAVDLPAGVNTVTIDTDGTRTVGSLIFGDTDTGTAGTWTLATGTPGGTLTLAGTTPTITANINTTISAAILGTSGLTKSGSATLSLTGANNFSGGINVSQGVLSATGAALKTVTGTITVASGGVLSFNQEFNEANPLAQNLNISGNGNGSYGALNLGFNSTASGAVTLDADATISNDYNFGTVSGSITGENRNLVLKTINSGQAGLTISGAVSLGTGSITVNSATAGGNATPVTISNGSNIYSGGTIISNGTLAYGNVGALGSGNVTFTGNGTLRANVGGTLARAIAVNSGMTGIFDTNNNSVTLSGALTGSGNFTKSGTNTLTLTGGLSNTLGGSINVNAGTLNITDGLSHKNMSGTITVASGAILNYGQNFNSNNLTNALTLSGSGDGTYYGALNVAFNGNASGAITLAANTTISHDWNNGTVSGSITGTNFNLELKTTQKTQGPLTISGPISLGTGAITVKSATDGISTSAVKLSVSNSYSGGTNISSGTLAYGNVGALGSGNVTFTGNGTLQADVGGTLARAIAVNSGMTGTFNTNNNDVTLSGALTGSGNFTKSGTKSLTLAGGLSNTLGGSINVNAGFLSVADGLSLPNNTLNTTTTITVASGASFYYSRNFGTNGGSHLHKVLNLSGSGAGGGYGALNLAGNADAKGAITLAADATISHDYNNATVSGTITGSGKNLNLTTIVAGQSGLVVSGNIQTGAGGVSVNGAANSGGFSVQLGGNNTFTGGLTINNGVVQLNSTGALNSTAGSENAVTFGAGTTTGKLALNGRSYVISNLTSHATPGTPFVENNNAASVTLTVGNSQNLSGTYAGVIQNGAAAGTLGLTKAGNGTLTLTGTNTYAGATQITGGTLAVTGNGSINGTSGVNINGGTFRYNSSVTYTGGTITNNGGTIGGTGPIGASVALDSTSDILAPGNSPGIQIYSVGQSWSSFTYQWEVNDFNGITVGTDYDQIQINNGISGTLALTGTTAGSYILDLVSLAGLTNVAGNVADFSETTTSWNILTTTGGITGFNDDYWTINDAGFTSNPAWDGTWSLSATSNNLVLTYTVPEPASAILIALASCFGTLRRCRRK